MFYYICDILEVLNLLNRSFLFDFGWPLANHHPSCLRELSKYNLNDQCQYDELATHVRFKGKCVYSFVCFHIMYKVMSIREELGVTNFASDLEGKTGVVVGSVFGTFRISFVRFTFPFWWDQLLSSLVLLSLFWWIQFCFASTFTFLNMLCSC